jgi:hypothetical protein
MLTTSLVGKSLNKVNENKYRSSYNQYYAYYFSQSSIVILMTLKVLYQRCFIESDIKDIATALLEQKFISSTYCSWIWKATCCFNQKKERVSPCAEGVLLYCSYQNAQYFPDQKYAHRDTLVRRTLSG